jgi:hypothetical protein
MFAYTLGEKHLLRDHAFSQFLCVLLVVESLRFIERTRMSLSHLGGLEQHFARFRLVFVLIDAVCGLRVLQPEFG